MIYTKSPDKRKKISSPDDLLSSDPLKVSDHVTETLHILRCVQEGDYAAISKRLSTGQSMMSVREPGTGSSIAHLSARYGDKAILKLLLRKYSDYTKMSNNQGRTAVHEAAEHGKFVCLTYLLQHGAVCKTRDRGGVTPLMLSAQKGHLQTLRRLALSDPETMMCNDIHGLTALHHSAGAGQEQAVRWLVEFGADDLAKDNEGSSAMHHAVTHNRLKAAIWLQHFSNCDARNINNKGHNSCHIAAQRGHMCLLHWMLSNKLVSPNEPGGKDGSTPVHEAAAKGQLDSLRCLKMYGANMHKKNFNDKTPKDIAAANKQHDCVRYLETIKKPKHDKSQKRANSLTRIVQALSISGDDKASKSTGGMHKSKRKIKGDFDKCMSDTESDNFTPWPAEKLNFNKTLPPPGDRLNISLRRKRAGSFNSSRSVDDDNRSIYSNGSGGEMRNGPYKPNSWETAVKAGSSLHKSLSSHEIKSPASSSPGSTNFDIMSVLRDEKRRQARLRQADCEDEASSVRSGSSYNGRGRSLSFLGSQDIIDRGSLACSPMSGYVPSPPPRSASIDPFRSSINSADLDLRIGSPQSPGPEMRSVSDRSSLALSDSSGDSSRQFVFPRQPCPIHRPSSPSRIVTGDFKKVFSDRPSSPSRIVTGDFKKVFSDRQSARMQARCTCRNSGELVNIPERRHASSRSISLSDRDSVTSPCGGVTSPNGGTTTLRRQNTELGRLDLDSFKQNWGTKTLAPPGWSSRAAPPPVPDRDRPDNYPQSSTSPPFQDNSFFGVGNGRSHAASPLVTDMSGECYDESGKKYRDGTTFRTSTNLSDICKL